MPDIFISYSKVDKAHAERLAAELKAAGFDVWWDADLYASQDYHNTIMQALSACKVAIVIWSPNAIKSEWVRDEARRAHSKKKLIPTYLRPFHIDDIPLGFGDIQTVDVQDRLAILKAIDKLIPPTHQSPDTWSDPATRVSITPLSAHALSNALFKEAEALNACSNTGPVRSTGRWEPTYRPRKRQGLLDRAAHD